MESSDFMWAIGLFEGEGYISLMRDTNPSLVYLYMGIEMRDRDVLERFRNIVEVGNVRGPYQRPGNRQPTSIWSVTGRKAVPLYGRMHPYLGTRRQAKGALLLTQLSAPIRNSKDNANVVG